MISNPPPDSCKFKKPAYGPAVFATVVLPLPASSRAASGDIAETQVNSIPIRVANDPVGDIIERSAESLFNVSARADKPITNKTTAVNRQERSGTFHTYVMRGFGGDDQHWRDLKDSKFNCNLFSFVRKC